MGAFAVTDEHDMHMLQKLTRQAGLWHRPRIVVANFDTPAHTIPPGRRPCCGNALTVEQVVSSSDPAVSSVVFNLLVDQVIAQLHGCLMKSIQAYLA